MDEKNRMAYVGLCCSEMKYLLYTARLHHTLLYNLLKILFSTTLWIFIQAK